MSCCATSRSREAVSGLYGAIRLFVRGFVVIVIVKPVADSEDVTVGVTQMHLAKAPGHVGRRPRNLEALRQAVLINGIHIVNHDANPRAFV